MTVGRSAAPLSGISLATADAVQGSGLHSRLLESLGVAICGGELAVETTITVDEIERRYDVSRTVVRETVRVLSSLGLVSAKQGVGLQVQAASEWNVYAPEVIRWRLRSPARMDQLRALIELRIAIEPEAAMLAAQRAAPGEASELMRVAGELWAAGRSGDAEAFLAHDIRFHRLILSGSGNPMFARLGSLIAETLTGRESLGLTPDHPHADALQSHVDIASAIQRGDGEQARTAMRGILLRTAREIDAAAAE